MQLPTLSIAPSDGGVVVVTLHGEHDLSSVDSVREALAGGGASVVADLSDATFIDSSILGVIVECSQGERPFAVAAPPSSSPEVQRLLELTGLSGLLPVYDSVPAAITAVRDGSALPGNDR
jgi:anti-sigma B factor antagonist